jgi:hypothetical protein
MEKQRGAVQIQRHLHPFCTNSALNLVEQILDATHPRSTTKSAFDRLQNAPYDSP